MNQIDKSGVGQCLCDFKAFFQRLADMGFDGAVLIEAYQNDYKTIKELQESLQYRKACLHLARCELRYYCSFVKYKQIHRQRLFFR